MKNNIIKRVLTFCLMMTMLISMTGLSVSANESSDLETQVSELEYGTSVTYDIQSQEITYGADQNNVSATSNLDSDSIITSNGGEISILDASDIDNEVSPYGIVGTDDRYRVLSTTTGCYQTVCYVSVTFPDGYTTQGSGTLVYANVLLTAGHVVYNSAHGGFATSLTVIPGRNGDVYPFGSAMATRLTTNNAWINNRDRAWDWGIVDLSSDFNTWQIFGYYYDYNANLGASVDSIGYPSDHPGYMYTDTNSISSVSEYNFYFLNDTYGGDSGGPLIDKAGILIGIIAAEHHNSDGICDFNLATRITEDLFNRLNGHIDGKK